MHFCCLGQVRVKAPYSTFGSPWWRGEDDGMDASIPFRAQWGARLHLEAEIPTNMSLKLNPCRHIPPPGFEGILVPQNCPLAGQNLSLCQCLGRCQGKLTLIETQGCRLVQEENQACTDCQEIVPIFKIVIWTQKFKKSFEVISNQKL